MILTYIKIIEICEILIMHNYQKWKERLAHERINANCTTERLFIYGAVTRVTYLPGLGGGAIEHVERTLNQLNGYHEDILEVLKNAASRRDLVGTPSGSNLLDEDALRKSLAECGYPDVYRKDTDGQDNGIDNGQEEEEDDVELQPPCGTIRIRNLEDLIRQLEHRASARPYMTGQMSPSGSEEIRTSETEPDRHYRIDSSVCSESSQGSRRCSRGRDEDASRFVYGRYRQPTSRSPYGNHQHTHQHSHQMHPEDEGIYETADPDRGSNTRGETPDCESSTTSSPVD